ncbi:hypothetical protein ACQEVC_02460 [Plantactinospora sp. CA-294935]|uniref:hypothetical protein n=1 Tax=Plantactinospora sp. CA-294935 TaxID=3240012 RepID=UPI003D8A8948
MEVAGAALLAGSTVVAIIAVLLLGIRWASGDDLRFATSLFLWAGRGICVAAPLMFVGRYVRRQAALLRDFTLVLDDAGAHWSGAVAGSVAWTELDHVVVTARPRRARRLIFARRRAGQAGPTDATVRASPVTHLVQRLVDPSRWILDVPIDHFEQPAESLVQVLRSASGGRFPDLYPAEQFPRTEEAP